MITIYLDKRFNATKTNGQMVEGVVPHDLYSQLKNLVENTKTDEDVKQEFIDEKLSEMTDEEVLEKIALVKDWRPNTGYELGELVKYTSKIYRLIKGVTAETNIYTPDQMSSEYEDLTKKLVQEDGSLAVWVQPLGAHDSYILGAKVQHNGKNWESTADNNTWEPGIYGWKEIV